MIFPVLYCKHVEEGSQNVTAFIHHAPADGDPDRFGSRVVGALVAGLEHGPDLVGPPVNRPLLAHERHEGLAFLEGAVRTMLDQTTRWRG